MSHINYQLLFTSAIYVNFYASTNNDVSGSGISQIMTDRLFEDTIYVFHLHGNVFLLRVSAARNRVLQKVIRPDNSTDCPR